MMSTKDQRNFRENLKHSGTRGLFDFWVLTASIDGLPRISDIRAETLMAWSDSIVMMKAQSRRNFSYSFYGTSFRKAFGIDMTGRSLDKLPPKQADQLRAEYTSVARKQLPVWRVYSDWFDTGLQTWERIALPFADASGEVGMIVAGAYRI